MSNYVHQVNHNSPRNNNHLSTFAVKAHVYHVRIAIDIIPEESDWI